MHNVYWTNTNEELRRFLLTTARKNGYRQHMPNDDEICISYQLVRNAVTGINSTPNNSRKISFEEFYELVSKPSEEPIIITMESKNYEVEFRPNYIKVGCTEVSHETIKKICKRANITI